MSDEDIEAGQRWQNIISQNLEQSEFGVICLTPVNAQAQWVLFEAGALAKSLESRLTPLVLGMELGQLTGPLTQFQAMKIEKASILKILKSMNSVATQSAISDETLNRAFEMCWPQLASQIEQILKIPTSLPPQRKDSEILEELVVSVRNLDTRVANLAMDLTASEDFPRSTPPKPDQEMWIDLLELSPRENEVLMHLAGQQQSVAETAKRMGISSARVLQLRDKAYRKVLTLTQMRTLLAEGAKRSNTTPDEDSVDDET